LIGQEENWMETTEGSFRDSGGTMFKRWFAVAVFAAFVFLSPALSRAQSVSQPHWVGTWATASMLADNVRAGSIRMLSGVTLRQIAHISVGGTQLRVRLTNEFGLDPLTISDAHVALSAGGSSIQPGSDHPITFGGASTVNVPPGGAIFSDPVALQVTPLADIAVTIYLPPQVMRAETFHYFADRDNFVAMGDVANRPDLSQSTTITSWYFFNGIDVTAGPDSYSIVALGDSITDGSFSTANANRRWPDVLASRLQADASHKNVGVLNVGIGGNRLLNEVYGPSAISRIDRDVLSQSGVRYIIILESINDIGRLALNPTSADNISAEQLEWGFRQIVDAAHEHGIKAIGATLPPYGGAASYFFSDKGEQIREAVNNWIRSSGTFDGVVDFDGITQDRAKPTHLNADYDSGDHVHPNDAGYKIMGAGIDLSFFTK
jgi:lysophospholipase L1-like esterase